MNTLFIKTRHKNENPITNELFLRDFASARSLTVDSVFYDTSGEKEELGQREEFLAFLDSLGSGDTVILASIEQMSFRVGELVQILSKLFEKNCSLLCAKDGKKITPATPAAEIIARLAATRKENIKSGISKLGRPKGSRSKSKYDAYLPQITEYLKTDRNISALARRLGISRTSLKDYIASRGL